MKEEFVPYELAVKLKQLGFDKPCFGYYQHTRLKLQLPTIKSETQVQTYMLEEDCSAPILQQAFRWFRKPQNGSLNHLDFMYEYLKDSSMPYEEAELACLEKLIEIVNKHELNKSE